jgi:DNA-binding CsgD family transcriptional regulator
MSDARGTGSRTPQGRFVRSTAEIEHDAEAARLRGEGLTYAAIGRRLGISKAHAWEAVHRVFRDTLTEPAEQARAVELARLETLHDKAMEVLEGQHVTVSNGQIVRLDGQPLPDSGPVLAAINTLVKVGESRRKLLGLDAPSRVSVDAEHLGQEVADILNALTQAATDDDTST